jgi:hypothetical protein
MHGPLITEVNAEQKFMAYRGGILIQDEIPYVTKDDG